MTQASGTRPDDQHAPAPGGAGGTAEGGGTPAQPGAGTPVLSGGGTGGGGGATSVVVAVSVLGVALTGLFLVTVGWWAPVAVPRVFAVCALVAALTAVLVAVLGHLLAALPGRESRRRRGMLTVLAAGGLMVLAVLSAGVAALAVPRTAAPGGGTEPSVSVLLSGSADARVVLVRMVFPDLAAGSQLDATLVGFEDDGEGGPIRTLLARSLVRTGGPGAASAELTATLGVEVRRATATATVAGRSCVADFSVFDEASAVVRCRR